MVCTLSYQMYKYEHGLTAAEQRAADVAAGETAAALTHLQRCLGRTFRPRDRVRPDRKGPKAATASLRSLSSVR
jgi:hypothetical protein